MTDVMSMGRIKIFYPITMIICTAIFFLVLGMACPVSAAADKHKIFKIVIDPGHGGKDPGAIGPAGEKEKDITLAVAKILERDLLDKGFRVYLTRKNDVFVPLEERTAFANKRNADLFVSIHVNANEKDSLQGVETYFLNLTTDASSIKVAERENVMASKAMSDLQFIIKDLMLNARINESSRFASTIQNSIVSSFEKLGIGGMNHGVKQAPFYVLMGAQMPSVLVEIGYITNSDECRLLQKKGHQETIVRGIVRGISTFLANTNYAYNRDRRGETAPSGN
jgi:N-acetylmuramoyl-L-alanine amidase